MTDLAIWRQPSGVVVRIHGSEHLLSPEEFDDHLGLCREVEAGRIEALSADYTELTVAAEARKQPKDLLAILGMAPKPRDPIRRRI
jgi:hypothetical protein